MKKVSHQWRGVVRHALSLNTPVAEIVEKVYGKFPDHFKSKSSCKKTVQKYINEISKGTSRDGRPPPSEELEQTPEEKFDHEIQEQRTQLELQAQRKHDKALAKKMAIADFVIEGCQEQLSIRPKVEVASLATRIEKVATDNSLAPTQEQVMVLELSDIQAGTLITKESTGGLNEFNWDILCKYFDNLFVGVQEVTRALQMSSPITKLHIHMLGDIVEGSQIFPGQEQHICKDLFHQAIGVVGLIEDFILKCLTLFDEIHITAVCGNHGRVGKKGENPHWVNWDRIVYEFVKRELVNYPNITWKMDDSWWQIDTVFSYKFYLTHGDDIRCWAGIPYYGVDRSAQRETELLRLANEWYDYFMIGHLHTPSIIPGVATTKFINGCFPGGTIFSMKNMGVASRPQQWLLVVHPKWGVTYNCPIYLNR